MKSRTRQLLTILGVLLVFSWMAPAALAQPVDGSLLFQASKSLIAQPAPTPDKPKVDSSTTGPAEAGSGAPEAPKTADVQPPTEGDPGGDSEPPGEPPELDDLFQALATVVKDWRALGWLAGVVALMNLLLLCLRFKPLDEFLEKKDWKKYKPWVAMGVGGLLTFFSSLAGGANWWQSLLAAAAGVVAGLASVGVHNVATKGNKK